MNLDYILVFKTNIRSEADKASIKEVMEANEHIIQWSIDCEDSDCVLRIVSHSLQQNDIIELINQYGYQCTELV